MFSTQAPKRRRITGVALVTGAAGSLIVALSLGASLSGFVATITNSTNTAATAALAITETGTGGTCNSYDTTATCSTINKYGGTTVPMTPGSTAQTTVVTFKNTGTVAVTSSSLVPDTCVATTTGVVGSQTPTTPNTDAGNLCSVLNIAVYKGATATGTALYNGSAANLSTITLTALAASASQAYTFVASLPLAATTVVQGQKISQPLTWNFNA